MARTIDEKFAKYAESGAYHWTEIGSHWIWHNAFTAERYRRVLEKLEGRTVRRLLDVGSGDGALLWLAHCRLRTAQLDGLDPNDEGRRLAKALLERHGVPVALHADWTTVEPGAYDAITCTEVIEHVSDPARLLENIGGALRASGIAVVTTPIRLTEEPEDPNHRYEWFPNEFRRLCEASALRLVSHESVIPAASAEAYFWRPPVFARVPLFRVLCNLLSIYGGVKALTWLGLRRRLFMLQIAVLQKP
jgi:2-polyprenyl-3-methyl-5-hydroxy-6-metoxy-1,4-benzoquinol methylase